MKQWWKECVFYQIYVPSFCDGNHDGIGDFRGIRSKLGYLKELGIGCVWLTPFYSSPKVDQGYDISDYYQVDKDYGTMEDFELFVKEAHRLGIRVISDIVINHTSYQHPWFQESSSSIENPKRDWYIWKPPVNGKKPNNWQSFFGEKAWTYDERTNMYYYHSFAREQTDLNWANPQVKQAVFDMLDFWVGKGIDGFRLDVINNLTLTGDFRDNPSDEKGEQIHLYDVNQRGIHDFMRELKRYLSRERDLFLVGEISSDQLERIQSFVGDGQLDTTFNFNLGSMEKFDLNRMACELRTMMERYGSGRYPTIFFGSHDMPRFIDRFHFSENQAKVLFTLQMCCRGIPFLYNGDEIGMRNYVCRSINDARDIQGIIAYHKAVSEGKSEEEAVNILNRASRDHSRNTMYWEDTVFGGFSDTKPWIEYRPQPGASAFDQARDDSSLLCCVSKLIGLRSRMEALAYGECRIISDQPDVLICEREWKGTRLTAVMNFSENEIDAAIEGAKAADLLFETAEGCTAIMEKSLHLNAESAVIIEIRNAEYPLQRNEGIPSTPLN